MLLRAPLLLGLATLAGLAVALGEAKAVAAEPAQEPPKEKEKEAAAPPDDDPDTGQKRAPAPDQRTGHVYFGVQGTAVGPAGAMGPNTPSTSLARAGLAWGGFLGIGAGRHATVQIFGDRTTYLAPGVCNDPRCRGFGYTAGLGVSYHLLQGIAFDPYASFGVAYRYSSFDILDPSAPKGQPLTQVFHGLDVARITLGGDFYPTPFFGFGPFVEADFGTNLARPPLLQALPPGVYDSPRTYAFFSVGLRVAFDPMRRAMSPATAVGSTAAHPGL